jgi:uncharacterized membrane protein YheB (UPF0754 family)
MSELSDKEHERQVAMAMSESFVRRQASPIDEAKLFLKLRTQQKWSITEISRRIGNSSRRYIANRLKLLKLPEQMQQEIHQGRMSMTAGLRWLAEVEEPYSPFRGVCIPHECLTSTVIALAKTIHQDKNFGILPILADALEDANYHDQEALNHLRSPHINERCWVIAAILLASG